MRNKKKKLLYIRIKNSWRKFLDKNKMIHITTGGDNFPHNPKHASNEIIMDFKNREEIIKFGAMAIGPQKNLCGF